jgi:hypothetical protein
MRTIAAIACVGLCAAGASAQYCEDVDVVHDGVLNFIDIAGFFDLWGTADPAADFNLDDLVDGRDLGYMLAHFYPGIDGCLKLPTGIGNLPTVVEDVTDVVNPPPGMRAYDVFVKFQVPGHVLINVYDANLDCNGAGPCFLGSDAGSYLTIGAEPHFISDPNFDHDAFDGGASLGADAGWWAQPMDPPPGLAGADPDNKVQIARIVMPKGESLTGFLKVIYYRPEEPSVPLIAKGVHIDLPPNDCYADFNNDGQVNILDFVAFQNAFVAGDFEADCNGCGCLNIIQFLCFQQTFEQGCD